MEPSCIDLYVFAGQSNVLGWGVGPLEMQRVLSAHRRLAGEPPMHRNIHLAAQGHFELGVAVAERLSKS